MSWRDWASVLVGILILVVAVSAPDLGNPFAADVPVEQWFAHRVQWDPEIGCGTEACR
jgi:hypothetical protein